MTVQHRFSSSSHKRSKVSQFVNRKFKNGDARDNNLSSITFVALHLQSLHQFLFGVWYATRARHVYNKIFHFHSRLSHIGPEFESYYYILCCRRPSKNLNLSITHNKGKEEEKYAQHIRSAHVIVIGAYVHLLMEVVQSNTQSNGLNCVRSARVCISAEGTITN